ncbi:MAG TPA: DUF354 domain-containing protein, partial [Verrucomicrobiae bacterium]|nr:DUF354 domain-containing protein [Verrucomicrobiae bacterium]
MSENMFVRTYYQVKPLLPSRLRLAARRWRAERRRERFSAEWPIDPKSAAKPAGWNGWPDDKKFALVLTHDVEGQHGLDQCLALAGIEKARGLRSAFNFVPEGEYQVPVSVREQLTTDGFEVGVHDLHHDGKLYWSRAAFRRNAEKINRYLHEWNATGFRSGFMHHNLEWLHDLDVAYDSSTFDTDPFEPQPDGAGTIFPFWVHAPVSGPQSSSALAQSSILNPQSSILSTRRSPQGYIELPYTLPQDFSLFLLLQEQTIDIWKRKIDWIAEHGGMAMLDVHPDYVDLKGAGQPGISFPIAFYTEFLDYVQTKYAGQYWLALPREVAQHAQASLRPKLNGVLHASPTFNGTRRKIWIDLDNTPHVPLFEPIIEELRARNFDVVLTARDAFQVCDLADQKGIKYRKVG